MTEISDYSNIQNLDGRPFLGPRAPDAGLKGSGGGGPFDGMEARVARLEAHVDNVRENIGLIRVDAREAATNIGTIKTDLATLRQKVDTLSTKGWGVTVIVSLGAVVAVLIGISTAINLFVLIEAAAAAPSSAGSPSVSEALYLDLIGAPRRYDQPCLP